MSKKHLKLLDYQEKLVKSLEPEVSFGGAGDYFIDSCVSSGKSFMMAAAAQELSGRVVILISIEPLLLQIAEHLDIFDEEYSILKAGYDKHFDPSKRIQLIMAQTMYSRLESIDLKAEWIIQDEGHREFRSKRTNDILAHLSHHSRFLFSGTCYDSQGFQFEGTAGIFKTVPMKDLIENGRLCPVRYYVPKWANAIDYDSVKLTGGEYNTSSLEEIINSNTHLSQVLESMNFMNAKNKKTLVFCSSIEQCNLITNMLKVAGYNAEAVHSEINKKDNDAVLEAFKHNSLYAGTLSERKEKTLFEADEIGKPIQCLVSVNKLGIGYSVEDVVLGVILRPTKIRALAVQIEGRQYRSFKGKEFAEILDLAQLTKNFGFAEEEYTPPLRTGSSKSDRILMDKTNAILAMEKLEIILNQDNTPTLVTRELYDSKLKDIYQAEKEFIASKEAMRRAIIAKARDANYDPEEEYIRRVATIINTTNDFYALISAGAEFWTIINGRPISKAGRPYDFNAEWLSENIKPVLDRYPEKHNHWIKSYRTRVKNLCKTKGNYNGIKFFIDFLLEKYEEELEAEKFSLDTYIPEEEIPF
ncbi:MAG: DEAD/DEAH box helicase family protein [Ignisphaera sp.]|nr:DEAD/DEAH box helicase family protein [Ignisphaera sp.]